MFSFLRIWQTVFESDCIILPPHQQWVKSFCCSTSSLEFGVVLDFGHPNRFVVISHCFLYNTYREHLFIYLSAICIFSLVRCLDISSPFFILYFFVFMMLNFRISLHTILKKYFIRFVLYKYFLPACSLYFLSPSSVLCRAEILNINIIQFTDIFLSMVMILVLYLKGHHQTKNVDFLLCCLLKVL